MEKSADNQHPIHDLLRRRWSLRAFAARPGESEKLLSLFEAGPVSRNEPVSNQPDSSAGRLIPRF